MKVKIKKKMLVNVGNFSNIECEVEIERELSANNFKEEYNKLSNLTECCLFKDLSSIGMEMNTMREKGELKYLEMISKVNFDKMIEENI